MITLIIAGTSAIIAFSSFILACVFKRKESIAHFESVFFKSTKAISAFIYDAYEQMTVAKFLPTDKIDVADKQLTEDLTTFEIYGKVHKNDGVVTFAVINSKDKTKNDVSFSYHFLIILSNYTKYRKAKVGRLVTSADKEKLALYIRVFWDFVNLYTKYIRNYFYNDFLSCKRRHKKNKNNYENELIKLVLGCVQKGVYR